MSPIPDLPKFYYPSEPLLSIHYLTGIVLAYRNARKTNQSIVKYNVSSILSLVETLETFVIKGSYMLYILYMLYSKYKNKRLIYVIDTIILSYYKYVISRLSFNMA